jgi:hypothetical protein
VGGPPPQLLSLTANLGRCAEGSRKGGSQPFKDPPQNHGASRVLWTAFRAYPQQHRVDGRCLYAAAGGCAPRIAPRLSGCHHRTVGSAVVATRHACFEELVVSGPVHVGVGGSQGTGIRMYVCGVRVGSSALHVYTRAGSHEARALALLRVAWQAGSRALARQAGR